MVKLNIQLFADGKVTIETDLNDSGFKKGLDKMQSIAKTGFKTIATSVGVVATAMAGALGYGVKYNAEIEQLTTSFEVMTGSADKAAKLVERLKKVGAQTPYELKGLASTVQLLMQYGMTADEAYDATLSLGDIAQGSAEKMQGIALALGQMSSYGKVTLVDIKQMITNGFNPLQEISDRTGESMESLYDRISKGTLSVNEIKDSFAAASSKGGKFYQSMEKQSRTLQGQLSTLKDNVSSLVGVLSDGLSNAIRDDVLPAVNDFLQALETAFSEKGFEGFSEAFGTGIANMLTTIAEKAPQFINSALIIIRNFVEGIKTNLSQITESAISLVMTLIEGCISMSPEVIEVGIMLITSLLNGISQKLDELIPLIIKGLGDMIIAILENRQLMVDASEQLMQGLAEGIESMIPALIDMMPELIESLLTNLLKNLPQVITFGPRFIFTIRNAIKSAIPDLLKAIPDIIVSLVRGLLNGLSQMKDAGKQLINGLWNGIQEKWNGLKNKVSSFGQGIVNKFKDVFGIHSPSRVFRDEIGKQLSAGIGVGFEDELSNVYNDMQRAIDLETSKMSANVQAGGTYQMAMAGLPTFNLLDNTENTTQLVVNGKVLAEVVNTENRNREVAVA